MGLYNLGSIATDVLALVDGVPTTLSGTTLLNMCDRVRLNAENYTGLTIGSTSIAEKYQPALVDLCCAELLNYMEVLGADVSSFSLGDISSSKGAGSNVADSSRRLREQGMEKLRLLGYTVICKKANV